MAPCKPTFFDPAWYLRCNEDVAAANRDPVRHYLRHGRGEGRLPCAMNAPWRERDLEWGLLEDGTAALTLCLEQGTPADRAWARIALARLAARRGDWAGADAGLRLLDPADELIGGFCLPDPALLAIEAAIVTGDLGRAHHLIRLTRRLLGNGTDLRLATANLIAARSGAGSAWNRHMGLFYARAGLGPVRVAPAGIGSRFDRLEATTPISLRRSGPLVSVIMPARDAADTIATALRSLQRQSWRRLEILVVDNGSRDNTPDIVRHHAATDTRIRLLDGGAEPGAYPARNIGLAEARGSFVTVLDADDWAHPARIALQVKPLLRRPECMASLSDWVRCTPDLRFTRWWGERGLVHRNISSLMIRTELRARLGYWDRVRGGADSEYHDRLLRLYGKEAIAEVSPGLPLSFGRVRDGSLTRDARTGIQSRHDGPRHDYRMAARRWHDTLSEGRELPLPQHPARRPFAAPPALALQDPDPSVTEPPAPFDPAWYMRTYPDLRLGDPEPWTHYQNLGAAEGRDPGPGFSTTGYRLTQGLTKDDPSPLTHALQQGEQARAAWLPDFEGALAAAPDRRGLLFFGHQARARLFGAERSLLDVLDRAIGAGFTPTVVMPNMENAAYLDALRTRAHKVHIRPYGWVFGGVAPDSRTLDLLTALIRDSGAAEVHQNTLVLDAPLRAARAAGVPNVVHARELPAQDPRLCHDLGLTAPAFRAHMLSWGDRFIANSQAVADWLDLPQDRISINPNTVDADLATLPFAPAAPVRVALIGSLTVRKGLRDMVTLARLCRSLPARFLLIGPEGPDLAAIGPLPAGLEHIGYCDSPRQAMEQADIVLCLSHSAESFGRTVLEALVAGRPVICYDSGTPPALLGNSGAGHVVPVRDIRAVAHILTALLRDPARLEACAHAARQRGAQLRAQAARIPDNRLFRTRA